MCCVDFHINILSCHAKTGPMTFRQIIILLYCKVKFPAGRQRFLAFVNITQMYTVFPASQQLNVNFKWTFYHIRWARMVFLPSGYSCEVMRVRLNHSSDNHHVFIIRKPFVCIIQIHCTCTDLCSNTVDRNNYIPIIKHGP